MVNFLPFASPKNSNKQKLVSNTFNQSYSSESTISTYWLYAIPSMFNMLFVLSYLWMKMFMLLIAMEKNWLYSSHELDAQCSFICIIKLDPLWLRLWCLWLDECFGLEVSPYVLSHGKLSTRSSSHLVDIMCFCLWMLIMWK